MVYSDGKQRKSPPKGGLFHSDANQAMATGRNE